MSRVADKLAKLVAELAKREQEMLLAFAEFLTQRATGTQTSRVDRGVDIPRPKPLKRPKQESVVKAIKRLSKSYPMLDKSMMLQDTYPLVLQHNMQGRSAKEVIDELEQLFEKHYETLQNAQ